MVGALIETFKGELLWRAIVVGGVLLGVGNQIWLILEGCDGPPEALAVSAILVHRLLSDVRILLISPTRMHLLECATLGLILLVLTNKLLGMIRLHLLIL